MSEVGLKWVCQVSYPRRDPAIDVTAPNARKALTEYMTRRTPETLAALPLKKGAALRLYGILPLEATAYGVVMGNPNEAQRNQLAVLAAVRYIQHPNGTKEQLPLTKSMGVSVADDSVLDTLVSYGGFNLIDELANHIIERAKYGDAGEDDTFAPFRLGRGLVLAL